ncbi:RNA-binding protein [Actinopolyspora erythraea]|uniref:RNA-binding protein n=1 Tax=Actinopolyspora erythraea TaxID=414996 RepID=A0ABR4WY88_9ACTN|nr:TROVE domain-containing protein [Actinopolyspora erythraea]KGI79350.1 RNA-binding protein [Actinopolyspora erythraea]
MAKFNTTRTRPTGVSPISTEAVAGGRTTEGHPGYERDWRGELFLLAVTNMVGEPTFYESARARDARYRELVRHGAVTDPDWTGALLRWLRREAHLRSAPIVGAAEFVSARRDAGLPGQSRQVVAEVCQRADEPGEMLSYWNSRYGPRNHPKSLKRGIADAVRRLWDERAVLKWDSGTRGVRFADVLQLCHPSSRAPWQEALFRYLLDRRYAPTRAIIPAELETLRRHARLMRLPVEQRRMLLAEPDAADQLRAAGVTWEALAGWLQAPMDRLAWETVLPSMGFMARLRNLRNIDQAGVSDDAVRPVIDQLCDEGEVARSRQMPMRFLAAYRQAPSLRWSYPLEQALGHSLRTVPWLEGSTLILVDTSASMDSAFSKDGSLRRWDAAAIFGLALGARCAEPTVVSFSGRTPRAPSSREFAVRPGESVLAALRRWTDEGFFLRGGTETAAALRRHYDRHDRVVILTDEQAHHSPAGEVTDAVPHEVPLHTFNLAGYRHGHAPSGSVPHRYTYGGLTDACFRLIPLVEQGQRAAWPWETS